MPALLVEGAKYLVPQEGEGPLDRTVAANYERFDGLDTLDNYGTVPSPTTYGPVDNPRPGQSVHTPLTYTPGPLSGLTNTLGGQPLPVADWRFAPGDYTPAHTPQTMQHRFGNGQAYQGVAQTVALGDIINNPPQPDSLDSILRGWA